MDRLPLNTSIGSIILSLRKPTGVHISEHESADDNAFLSINGVSVEHGYPDWLGFPDILYDEETRIIVGLVFPIADDFETAYSMCSNFDESIVRFRDRKCDIAKKLYLGDDDELWLEVSWGKANKLAYMPAQLAEILFYFDQGSDDLSGNHPIIAFEFFRVANVLEEFGLRLPDLSKFPPLQITPPSAPSS